MIMELGFSPETIPQEDEEICSNFCANNKFDKFIAIFFGIDVLKLEMSEKKLIFDIDKLFLITEEWKIN
jgi:hypothetical protein